MRLSQKIQILRLYWSKRNHTDTIIIAVEWVRHQLLFVENTYPQREARSSRYVQQLWALICQSYPSLRFLPPPQNFVVVRALKNDILKNSPATSISRFSVPNALDNIHNTGRFVWWEVVPKKTETTFCKDILTSVVECNYLSTLQY